ncbi:3-hydroxyacyl-CoA dehydrogenase [Diaporthe amygdali]|uniref:3-hydroxyacyl-CoA dehydrogenase n=1 Tax=Phomopsis amygdali TaxID=1214568 RepID=UPI0022FDF06C|nr:3-hydroxyacyl-CoA dehydrogenase [Diaporthe amygdali]KAJ0108349.1 3-hydroxyacyl-CoA dehydrogenase [Diaporthe amygdali]
MKLEGKAFIITGGCGSIGGTTARSIIAKGGIAVIFDILPQEAGEAKVKEYHPTNAHYFKTDISDIDALSASANAALQVIPKGSLAGGVHCAAIAPSRTWSNKLVDSAKDFAKVLNMNAYGTFAVDSVIADAINSQYPDEGPFGPRTTEERGCIINIASAVAHPVPARCLTYGPTKTCVLGITGGMADFLGPYGIRVNSVSPAVVASALMGDRLPYFNAELDAAAVFPRRTSEATEVASGIVFLLENSMMNDFELRIDGGWRGCSNWAGPKDPRANAPALE